MRRTLLVTALTAIGATLCCTGPFLLLLFGFTSIGFFSFLEPVRPYATVLAVGLLGWAYYQTFRKPKQEECCELNTEESMKKQKRQKRILLGITPLLLALLLFPYYGSHLFGEEEQKATSQQGKVTEWIIEGMTCNLCAKGLEGGMSAVEGITNCTVDYASKTLVCTVDEQKVKVDDIPGLVEKMGYHARLKTNPETLNDNITSGL